MSLENQPLEHLAKYQNNRKFNEKFKSDKNTYIDCQRILKFQEVNRQQITKQARPSLYQSVPNPNELAL